MSCLSTWQPKNVKQTKLIFKLPGPWKGLHCLWYRPTVKECCLKQNSIKRLVSAYSRRFTMLSLPSPSGLSMLYSGIHSRNNSSISTAFFSVNLNQNQIDSPHKTTSILKKRAHLANSCRGLLPLLFAASADTLEQFYHWPGIRNKYVDLFEHESPGHLLSVRSTLAVLMWPSFTWTLSLISEQHPR